MIQPVSCLHLGSAPQENVSKAFACSNLIICQRIRFNTALQTMGTLTKLLQSATLPNAQECGTGNFSFE